ncbi:MAG: DUF192 domain-containing protein [Candidatus Magasanikbacteria bacterium]|nr:DUF192 domain-containing protein [Candidatus Magasanikbacteria bacterium]
MAAQPMKKRFAILFGLLVILAIALRLWQFHWPTAVVALREEKLFVLVARTPPHMYRGLGRWDSLGRYDGMLFLFPAASRLGMVMRDMKFPIDIIWLERGVVVDIAPTVPVEPGVPERLLRVYYPRVEANMVIETAAGWAERHSIKIGDRLRVIEE